MANRKEYSTTRIWRTTVYKLRRIRAETGEKIVAILERLVNVEFEDKCPKEKNAKQ